MHAPKASRKLRGLHNEYVSKTKTNPSLKHPQQDTIPFVILAIHVTVQSSHLCRKQGIYFNGLSKK